MSTLRFRRSVLPLAAASIVLLSAAAPAAAVPISWDFSGWLHGVLSSLWNGNGNSTEGKDAAPAPPRWLAAPSGCALDPDGRCAAAPAPAESGCDLDPNGRCRQ